MGIGEMDDVRGGEGKEAREEIRVQMQVLNEHVAALCASECLESFFLLSDFKCNTVTLLTDCILYRD